MQEFKTQRKTPDETQSAFQITIKYHTIVHCALLEFISHGL